MIEEFLIISPRGDTLLTKNYAGVAVGRARAAMQGPGCQAPFCSGLTTQAPAGTHPAARRCDAALGVLTASPPRVICTHARPSSARAGSGVASLAPALPRR